MIRRLSTIVVVFCTQILLFTFASPVHADSFSPADPGPLCCQGMAYFPPTVDRVFMFGGLNGSGVSTGSTYKWNWAFSSWESVASSDLQGHRSSTRMEFFGTPANLIVLFGGQDCTPTCGLSDNTTWVMDGLSDWQDCSHCDSNRPGKRISEGMAYGATDPVTSKKILVMFGGNGTSGPETDPASMPLQDTWTLEGSTIQDLTWTKCTDTSKCPTTAPSARSTPGMDYDSRSGNAVVFGGNGSSAVVGDTVIFNTAFTPWWTVCSSSQCTQPATENCGSSTPPPCSRQGHRMVFYDDGTNYGSFMFGAARTKQGVQLLNDAWFFRGGVLTGTWTKCVSSCTSPPRARCCVGMAFDSTQHKVLLYGGQITPQPTACGDTWSWSSSQGWHQEAGTTC